MKLLFCIKSMNNPGGGAERVLADIVNGLVDRGYEISLLTFDKQGSSSFYKLDSRINRIDLSIGSTNRRATIFNTLKRIFVMRRIIKKNSPDVAIGFMHSMFIPLGIALLGSHIPVIASEHTVSKHYESRALESLLLKISPYIVSQMTCVSEKIKETYSSTLQRKMVCIANPITVRSECFADVVGKVKEKKVLLSIGGLEKSKGHQILIEAFAMIASDVPNWNLKIIGEGSLRSELEERISELHLKNRIELPGYTNDVSAEYLDAQLFASSSHYESFGLTIAEALMHGLPAIGFEDCPGINELINPDVNGMLVKVNKSRPESLAKVLKPLMLNAKKRESLAAGAVTLSDYGLEAILLKWEALLNEV